MIERTGFVVAGKKTMIPRVLKRLVQIAATVTLTASVLLVVIVGNGFLVGKAPSFRSGWNLWLTFIQRPDILSTMTLTAIVAVLFLYWQRNQERKAGASGRT
jgi:ABC-type sulfate transport system permease subunit